MYERYFLSLRTLIQFLKEHLRHTQQWSTESSHIPFISKKGETQIWHGGLLTRLEYKFPFCLLPKLQNNLSVSAQAQISLQCWCLFVLSKFSNDICTIIKYLEDWLDSGALKTNPLKYFMWQEMKQELKRRNIEKVIIQYLIFTKHQVSQRPVQNWSKSCGP